MTATQYRKKRPNIELFGQNANQELVIVSKVWRGHSKEHSAVSLYVLRGKKWKKLELVYRELFAKPEYTAEMLKPTRDIVAHLWAMHYGVSDFVVLYEEPSMKEVFHPSFFQSKEIQP